EEDVLAARGRERHAARERRVAAEEARHREGAFGRERRDPEPAVGARAARAERPAQRPVRLVARAEDVLAASRSERRLVRLARPAAGPPARFASASAPPGP